MTVQSKYNLSLYPREFPGTQSSYDIYPGDDTCLWSGVGTLDYPAFGDYGVDLVNEIEIYAFREGSDHNVTKNGNIMIMTRPNGGSWSVPSILVAHGGRQLTDVSVSTTSNGRWSIGYTLEPTGFRQQWHVFSDDQGDTWSTETRLTLEYDDNQITGPGGAIEVDGRLYRSFYARNAGPGAREGVIFSIGINDDWSVQNAWTRENLMYRIETFNGEEPTLLELSDNSWLCLVRSDPNDSTYTIWSPDKGVTWSRIQYATESEGKNPLTLTPNNTVISIGRSINGSDIRTILQYSKDSGKTWAVSNIDYRTGAYMYGGVKYVPWLNTSYAVWSVEMLGVTTPNSSGPCLIIQKELRESATPLSPPFEYDINYQSLRDYTQGKRLTMPAENVQDLLNQLFEDLKTDTIWTKLDVFYINFGKVALIEFPLHNCKQPNERLITETVAPTHNADGWEGNGTSMWMDIGWAPSNGVNYTQNDACAFAWVEKNIQDNGRAFGASGANMSTNNRGPAITPRNTSDQIAYCINNNTLTLVSGITDARGLNFAQRTSSTAISFWKNGVQINTASQTSDTRVATTIALLAQKFLNGTNLFSAQKISMFGAGSSLTGLESQLYTRLSAFRTAVLALP